MSSRVTADIIITRRGTRLAIYCHVKDVHTLKKSLQIRAEQTDVKKASWWFFLSFFQLEVLNTYREVKRERGSEGHTVGGGLNR